MPGSVEALALCRRLGLAVAVCSGSYAVVIEAALRRLDIESLVSVALGRVGAAGQAPPRLVPDHGLETGHGPG